MTAADMPASAGFEIGRVVSRALSVVGKNFFSFLALATLSALPVIVFTFFSVLTAAIGLHMGPLIRPGTISAVIVGFVAGYLLYFVFANLLQAAMMHGTVVTLNGGHASFFDCLATGVRHAVPLTIITVLATLGMMVGFVLLVVPGIILALAWSVIAPVRVTENTGILETFGRSARLTKGHRGSLFLLMLLFGVVVVVLDFVIRPLAGVSLVATPGAATPLVLVALTALVQILTAMIGASLYASAYYELRVIKEGVGPEKLAAVFA